MSSAFLFSGRALITTDDLGILDALVIIGKDPVPNLKCCIEGALILRLDLGTLDIIFMAAFLLPYLLL
jgi:hypothetical protein